MRKINTAGYTALLLAVAASTFAINANAFTIRWALGIERVIQQLPEGVHNRELGTSFYLVNVGQQAGNLGFNPVFESWYDGKKYLPLVNGTFTGENAPGVSGFLNQKDVQDIYDAGFQNSALPYNDVANPILEIYSDDLFEKDTTYYFILVVVNGDLNGEYTAWHGTFVGEYISSAGPSSVPNLTATFDIIYNTDYPDGIPPILYTYEPIPEPATGLLVLGGAAVALLRRRRR